MCSTFCIYYFGYIIYNNCTMGKTIRIIKLFSFVIILLEIVLGAAFSVLYFNNLFNLQSIIKPFYIALSMVVVIVVDCLFIWIVILILSSLRQKTDLRAADLIGSDIEEAYNLNLLDGFYYMGYVHEKGFVPSYIKINEESFELYEDIDRLLFCRGGGLTDSVILINQGDYERIAAGAFHEKCLRLFRFGNKGNQNGLADYIERKSGSDVASYYEAYKRASQSAELLKLLMGYISTVILANAIIAIYYKIETEKEKDVYKYKLLLSLGAERNLIRKCIKEKLIVATFFPLFISLIWMIIVSYINTFSYDHQVIAVCKCIGIGFTLGCLLYGVCKVYIKSILKEDVYTVTVL